jgi:hypothetical protein
MCSSCRVGTAAWLALRGHAGFRFGPESTRAQAMKASCANDTAEVVLHYAHEHGCEWDGVTCYYAAGGGHLEALRYPHEHGCPWDDWTCYYAAAERHSEVLRYAIEHGCPLHPGALAAALSGGHAEVAEYLRAAQPAA